MAVLLIPSYFFLGIVLAALVLVWGVFIRSGGLATFNDAIALGGYPDPYDGVKDFTGIRAVDDALMSMAGFNLPVLDESFPAGRLFMAQLLANVAVVPLIMAIEEQRGTTAKKSRSTLWALLSQLATTAVACPLYFYTHSNHQETTVRPNKPGTTTIGSRNAVLAILIGHVVGFGVPAIMMFRDPKSLWVLAFTFFPVLTAFCTSLISFLLKQLPVRDGRGYNAAQSAYALAAAVSAAFHAAFVVATIVAPEGPRDNNGFARTLSVLRRGGDMTGQSGSLADQVLTFLQVDYLLTFVSLLGWVYNALVVLYPSGAGSGRRVRIGGLLLVGSVVFGPGATAMVAWSIRETRMARHAGKRKD
ncbi:hypothetical protein QBC44DRAFT_322701 [Cladorrhinum sp. PSN332]|nr:hypothetical protein QBC44DRAFT_322701 [Cladorrhinum sp. PSN332]